MFAGRTCGITLGVFVERRGCVSSELVLEIVC